MSSSRLSTASVWMASKGKKRSLSCGGRTDGWGCAVGWLSQLPALSQIPLTFLLPWMMVRGTALWGHFPLGGGGFSQLHRTTICKGGGQVWPEGFAGFSASSQNCPQTMPTRINSQVVPPLPQRAVDTALPTKGDTISHPFHPQTHPSPLQPTGPSPIILLDPWKLQWVMQDPAPPTWAQYWDAETAWMSLRMGWDSDPAGETTRMKAVNFLEGL